MPDDFESDEMTLPMFQADDYVKETGMDIAYEGEYNMPAPGSEAVVEPMHMTQGVINYYFPVEVVIVGSLPEEERASLEARIWESLGDALERMT